MGKLGCLLVLVGCFIITVCGPKDQEVASMDEFEDHLVSISFFSYAGTIVIITAFLIYLSPKYGDKYLFLYVFIVGSYGSLAIIFCKGIGVAIKTTMEGNNAFTRWSLWVSIFCVIACVTIETGYTQVSLDLFNTSIVMSVTYVIYSTLIIASSAILFSSQQNIGMKDIVLTVLGFVVNVIALYMMNLDKNPNMDLKISSDAEKENHVKEEDYLEKAEEKVIQQEVELPESLETSNKHIAGAEMTVGQMSRSISPLSYYSVAYDTSEFQSIPSKASQSPLQSVAASPVRGDTASLNRDIFSKRGDAALQNRDTSFPRLDKEENTRRKKTFINHIDDMHEVNHNKDLIHNHSPRNDIRNSKVPHREKYRA